MPLTDKQKADICQFVAFGADRVTAVKCVESTWPDFQEELRNDAFFAIKVSQSEAASEVKHVENIKNAGTEKRHWRASQWWLERRATERYGQRLAYSISPRELEDLLMALAEILGNLIDSEELRNRLLEAIITVGDQFRETQVLSPLHSFLPKNRKIQSLTAKQ